MRQLNITLAKKMGALIVLLLISLCLPAKAQTNDEGFRRCLIGTWIGDESEKTFHDDGTVTGILHPANDSDKVVTFKSSWRVENGRLISEVVETSDSGVLASGTAFADKIVSITASDFVSQQNNGKYDLRKRVTPTPPDCAIGAQVQMNDVDLASKIIGTWVIDYDDGAHMEKTYRPDSTSSGVIVDKTAEGQQQIHFVSHWEVKDGYFLGEVLSSDDGSVPVGARYRDKIITVTDQEFVTLEEGSRQVTVKHRIQ